MLYHIYMKVVKRITSQGKKVFFSISFWPCQAAYRILVPWVGIEFGSFIVKVQSSNQWTMREFRFLYFFNVLPIWDDRCSPNLWCIFSKIIMLYTLNFQCCMSIIFQLNWKKKIKLKMWNHHIHLKYLVSLYVNSASIKLNLKKIL